MWKKLARLQEAPEIAVAYHTRKHGFSDRPEYLLVQGRAVLSSVDEHDWIERHRDAWERFAGPRDVGWLWERWLAIYHWRVAVEITVRRIVVWPDLTCRGDPVVHGCPLPPEPPAPQSAPKRGTGPRINHRRATRRIRRLPNRLVGWVDADGFPLVVSAQPEHAHDHGVVLKLPAIAPPGGRRAGLLAHDFARHNYGQYQRRHTGWLQREADAPTGLYAPHTEGGHHLPNSRFLYRLSAGWMTRRGLRRAREAGFYERHQGA
jgi:hypothetical protein